MEYADLVLEICDYMAEWLARFNDLVIETEIELASEVMTYEN